MKNLAVFKTSIRKICVSDFHSDEGKVFWIPLKRHELYYNQRKYLIWFWYEWCAFWLLLFLKTFNFSMLSLKWILKWSNASSNALPFKVTKILRIIIKYREIDEQNLISIINETKLKFF